MHDAKKKPSKKNSQTRAAHYLVNNCKLLAMSFRANSHEINPGKVVHKSGHLGTFPIAVHARRKKQRSCEPSVTSSIQLDISPVLPWDRVSVDNGRLFRTFHLQGFTFRNYVFFCSRFFLFPLFQARLCSVLGTSGTSTFSRLRGGNPSTRPRATTNTRSMTRNSALPRPPIGFVCIQ